MYSRRSLLIGKVALLAVGLGSLTLALAHHADALYDLKNPTTVNGVVTQIAWGNPHVYLYITAKNAEGQGQSWALELNSPHALQRRGWTRDTVKAGDTVGCTGGRARSGARAMRCITVQLAGGKILKS